MHALVRTSKRTYYGPVGELGIGWTCSLFVEMNKILFPVN